MGKDLRGKDLGPGFEQLPSGTYRFRYRLPDGTRIPLLGSDLKALRKAAGKIQEKLDDGNYVDPGLSNITLDEWFKSWLPKRDIDESSRSWYAQKYRLYVKPYLGNRPLRTIHPEDVEGWLLDLKRAGKSPATRRHAFRTLSACLGERGAEASRGRLPQGNPCRRHLCPEVGDAPWYRLDEGTEFQRLLDSVGGLKEASQRPMSEFWKQQHRALITTLAFTALRFGEIAALRRYHVNPLQRTMFVERAVTEVQPEPDYGIVGGVIEDAPKSGKTRTIPWLPDEAMDALNWQLDNATGADPNSLIWTGPRGGQLKHNNWHKRVWLPTVQRAGLAGVRPHDLRHSAASWLVERGVPMRAIQELLGHASLQMTERYVHVGETFVRAELMRAYGATGS